MFANRLDTTALPRTHSRGSKAVDHVWVSKYVLDNITHAGIAPFGYLHESENRGMFIEIDDTMLFHPEDSKLVYYDFRRLKSTIPKRIKKYMSHVKQCWGDQNIHDEYKKLLELCTNSAPVLDIQLQLTHLDNAIIEILIKAERQCTKLASHHTDVWTPELTTSLKNRRYWRTQLTKAQKLPNKIDLIASIQRYKDVRKKLLRLIMNIKTCARIPKIYERSSSNLCFVVGYCYFVVVCCCCESGLDWYYLYYYWVLH